MRRVTVTDSEGRTFKGRLLMPVRARGRDIDSDGFPPPERHPIAESIGAFAGFPAWDEFITILKENRRREDEAASDGDETAAP